MSGEHAVEVFQLLPRKEGLATGVVHRLRVRAGAGPAEDDQGDRTQLGNGLDPAADLGRTGARFELRGQQNGLVRGRTDLDDAAGTRFGDVDLETLVPQSARLDQTLSGVRIDQ